MKEYQRLLKLVLDTGKTRSDRTGTGTISVFGAQARFNLRNSFPCLTTKNFTLDLSYMNSLVSKRRYKYQIFER